MFKKICFFLMFGLVSVFSLTSCEMANPSYDEEVALKMKPWLFGDTRVDPTPVNDLDYKFGVFQESSTEVSV